MNSGLSPSDPTLVAAFRSALLHQGAIALLMLAFLWLLWATARTWRPAASPGTGGATAGEPTEARARWLLRTGFGVLWIFDGILQAQPKMAGGLATQVMEPIAASSPGWVQHLVNWGGTAWSYHPVQAGAASAITTTRLTAKPWRVANDAKPESKDDRKCGCGVPAISVTIPERVPGLPPALPCQNPRPGQAWSTAIAVKKTPSPASTSRPGLGTRQAPSGSAMSAPATT